jgi:hypothetical protein
VPESGYGTAGAIWNLAYDGGMGLGAAWFGLAAARTGYPASFALTAAVLPAVLAVLAAAGRRGRRTGEPGGRRTGEPGAGRGHGMPEPAAGRGHERPEPGAQRGHEMPEPGGHEMLEPAPGARTTSRSV